MLSKWDICLHICLEKGGDILMAWSQHKVSAMFKAAVFEWVTSLEKGKQILAVAVSS